MSYVIFDKGYEEFRKLYVRHIAQYPVQYKKILFHGIKGMLLGPKLLGAEAITGGGFRLFYDKEDLMFSLSGDMLRFRLKSIIHRTDNKRVTSDHEISVLWDIVTNYYSFFFSAAYLLRMLHRGTVFFDVESKKQVERIISNALGQIITIDSNCSFRIDYPKDCIEIYKSDGNVHEVVWKEIGKVIEEMLQFSKPRSFERCLLSNLATINSKKGATYPSKLRNTVNYQSERAVECIEKKIHKIPNNLDYIRLIGNYVYENNEPLDKTINIYSAYHQYVVDLADSFFRDYLDMVETKSIIEKYPFQGLMIIP